MKILTMTRDVPEAEGQPTKLSVPECEIETLKKRGWKVADEGKKEEAKPVKTEPAVQQEVPEDTDKPAEKETVNVRGHRRNH